MNTLQAVADIIKTGLNLTSEQIWLYTQRRNIPTTKGLFVIVGRVSLRPYGNNAVQEGSDLTSGQWMQEMVSIDLLSANFEAFDKVPNLLGALASPYSLFKQEQLGLHIAKVPLSIVDTSSLEGASMVFRNTITLQVLSAYKQTNTATFFDPDTIQYSLVQTEA